MHMRLASLFVLGFLGPGHGFSAPLPASPGDIPEIRNRLLAAAIGEVIQDECDRISPRWIRVLAEAHALKRRALRLGYDAAAIDEFPQSKPEQARFQAWRDAWLSSRGASPEKPESYCRIGEDAIAGGGYLGSLLRSSP